MAVSDNFSTLKEEVETADQRIRASAAQGATELKAMVDEARTKADAGAAQISTRRKRLPIRRMLTGTKSKATGTGTSSASASAPTRRRQSSTPMRRRVTQNGPRPTRTTPSSSHRPRSRKPSTPSWTLCWRGKTRTY